MPRVVGVVVAATTDFACYRLSSKLIGPGSAAAAVGHPSVTTLTTDVSLDDFTLQRSPPSPNTVYITRDYVDDNCVDLLSFAPTICTQVYCGG